MARLFLSDPTNSRRLVATDAPEHTVRAVLSQDGDTTVTTTIEWGPSPTESGRPEVVIFTSTEWPGGALLARVVRPWRRGGDWHACWNEVRRQVRDITGFDIGDAPHRRDSGAAANGADAADAPENEAE